MNVPLCRGHHPWKPSWPRGAKCLSGDNGVDPILGAPFPPVNYQLFIHFPNQPRLTWTVPDLILDFDPEDPMFGDPYGGSEELAVTYQAFVTDAVFPPWDSGAPYIVNSTASYNGVRYRSIVDNNTNHQPDTSPSFWQVQVDEILYKLWIRTVNTVTSEIVDFTPLLDSDGTNYNYTPSGFLYLGGTFAFFGSDFIPYMPFAVQRQQPAELYELYFYVSATARLTGVTAYSQTKKFLVAL